MKTFIIHKKSQIPMEWEPTNNMERGAGFSKSTSPVSANNLKARYLDASANQARERDIIIEKVAYSFGQSWQAEVYK